MRGIVITVLSLASICLTGCDNSEDLFSCVEIEGLEAPPPEVESNLPGLHLEIDAIDLTWLYYRDVNSNDRLPAEAIIMPGAQTVSVEGMRFRGNTARYYPKKSFNIRFEQPHELIFDSRRMNANAMYADASMMREHLAMGLFHELGQPAPRTRYLDMWINGIYEGLYLHVDRVDGDLLEYAGFNPDGTLVRDRSRYHGASPSSIFGFALSELPEHERSGYLASVFDRRGQPDWEQLVELVLWVEGATSGEQFADEFEQRIDLETFIDWLAIHYLIADVDSFGDDYWMYLDHEDEHARWVFIPWDKDLSFGSHTRSGFGVANDFFTYERAVEGGWSNRLVWLFLGTPSLREALDDRLQELMHETFDRDYFAGMVDSTYELIAPSVNRLPCPDFVLHLKNHHSAQGVAEDHTEVLLDFIELRYAFLDRQLNAADGQPYQAQVDLGGAQQGDVLMLTDADGWTIARLELLTAPTLPGLLSIEVTENQTVAGISRSWTLDSGASEFSAQLSLYYRNDTHRDDPPDTVNWYTGGETATGEQWRLQMAEVDEVVTVPVEGSRANPFSNKVSAPVVIEPGPQAFVLRIPD